MKRFTLGAIALAALAALTVLSLRPVAHAQAAPPPFMTVDAVATGQHGRTILVTGVVEGDSAPSTRFVEFTGTYDTNPEAREFCRRLLLVALAKPGQYRVQVGYDVCKVALVTP